MGRPERPLDPAAGPVEGFASQLRELRDQAGRPKYSTMALRAHRSRTGLSEAAGGERLPTWDTTEAFVRACGGDVASWRERWEQAERGAGGSPAQPPPAAPVDETAAPRQWRRTALLMTATAGVVVAATVAILALVRPSSAPSPDVPPSSSSSPALAEGRPAVADGADPKDSGCSLDPNVETLDSMEVDLRGRPVGLIELRYSAMCGVAWPRFEPFKLARIPATAVVHVDVIRPQTHQFRVPFQAKYVGTAVYGNVMRSTERCVYAAGRVELAGQRSLESRTHCFRGRIPEGAVG
jgi:hypothetical protein